MGESREEYLEDSDVEYERGLDLSRLAEEVQSGCGGAGKPAFGSDMSIRCPDRRAGFQGRGGGEREDGEDIGHSRALELGFPIGDISCVLARFEALALEDGEIGLLEGRGEGGRRLVRETEVVGQSEHAHPVNVDVVVAEDQVVFDGRFGQEQKADGLTFGDVVDVPVHGVDLFSNQGRRCDGFCFESQGGGGQDRLDGLVGLWVSKKGGSQAMVLLSHVEDELREVWDVEMEVADLERDGSVEEGRVVN